VVGEEAGVGVLRAEGVYNLHIPHVPDCLLAGVDVKARKKIGRKKKYRSPTKRLIDECDSLCRLIIKKRDTHCVTCGKGREQTRLDVGHLIKRGKHSVRWDLTNINAQCSGCNKRHNQWPEHYEVWYMTKYGQAAYLDLIGRAWKPIDRAEIESIRDGLMQTLEELNHA